MIHLAHGVVHAGPALLLVPRGFPAHEMRGESEAPPWLKEP